MRHLTPSEYHALDDEQRATLARTRGQELDLLRQGQRLCDVDGCTRVHKARGYCDTHYARWATHGDPGPAEPITPHPPVAATRVRAATATRRREERFEDVREMIEWRVHPEEIARRIGTTVEALERQAHRWGADDIAHHMSRSSVAA